MPEHHRGTDIDPEIASLARVKPSTWKIVFGGVLWLGTLSAGVTANSAQIAHKADKEIVELQRQADRDLLARELAEMNRRLSAIEAYQAKQTTIDEQARAIAEALKQANDLQREAATRR